MRQRTFAPVIGLVFAAILMALPGRALANAFDFYGFGTRGMGLAGTQAATADDYAAAYFNPSLLAFQDKVKLGLSLNWFNRHLSADAASGDMRPFNAVDPDDTVGLSMGFVFPFGGVVEDRLALGVGVYLPTASIMTVQSIDPDKPNWYLQQADSDRLALAVSLGVRVTDWFSLGLGIQVLGGLSGNVEMDMNIEDYEFGQRDVKVDVDMALAPIVGLTFRIPDANLTLALAYRGELEIDYELPVTVHARGNLGSGLKEIALIDVLVSGSVFYSPHTFTLGVEWKGLDDRLMLSAEARFALWSKAPDPTVGLKVNLKSDEDLVTQVLGEDFNVSAGDESVKMSNTLSLRLGAEYWFAPGVFAFRGGYAFTPTPVPIQNGATNLLDSDSHMISLGGSVYFHDPLEIFKEPVAFSLAAQLHFFPEREAVKSANYDVASYTYGGYVGVFSASLAYAF